jgi:DNA-binding IclR family transcriptional regulator
LGYAAFSSVDVLEVARPHLQQFADKEDALVVVATRDGLAMVCNEVCHSSAMLTLRVGVGSRLSLAKSAVGGALIGTMPEEERKVLLQEIRKKYESEWQELGPWLRDAPAQIRSKGFCTSIGTLEQGVNGIGVVLEIKSAPNTFVLGIAGSAFRFNEKLLDEELGPRLLKVKQKIEQQVASFDRPD